MEQQPQNSIGPIPIVESDKDGSDDSFRSLIIDIAIPFVILSYLSKDQYLGQMAAFVVALSFPLAHGIYNYITSKNWGLFSMLGIINVLLYLGIKFLSVDGMWLAIKEAAIPGIIGLLVLFSKKVKDFLVYRMFLNPKVINVVKINEAIIQTKSEDKFSVLIHRVTLLIAGSFFISAILNFVLARVIVTSPVSTPDFNAQVGKMMALSFPVIMIPCTIVLMGSLAYLFKGIKQITGFDVWAEMNNR